MQPFLHSQERFVIKRINIYIYIRYNPDRNQIQNQIQNQKDRNKKTIKMKKISQIFKPKKISAIFTTEKDVSHTIITLVIMMISIDEHHRIVMYKTQNEASNCKSVASKPTALIHLHPTACELNSNDSMKT